MEKEYSSWEELKADIDTFMEEGDTIDYSGNGFFTTILKIYKREPSFVGLTLEDMIKAGRFSVDIRSKSGLYRSFFVMSHMEQVKASGLFKNITRIRNKNLEVFN